MKPILKTFLKPSEKQPEWKSMSRQKTTFTLTLYPVSEQGTYLSQTPLPFFNQIVKTTSEMYVALMTFWLFVDFADFADPSDTPLIIIYDILKAPAFRKYATC